MSGKDDALAEAVRNLVKIFAYAQIKDETNLERKATFLRVFKLTEQEIADLVGSKQPTVHMALDRAKKKGRKGSKASNDSTANPKEGSQ